MCDYCENADSNLNLIRLEDGSRITELDFFRSQCSEDHVVLGVYESVKFNNNGEYVIHSKEIKIKYCPFCGKKLRNGEL